MLTKMGGLPDDDSVVAMAMSAVCQQLGFPVGLRPSKANVYFHRVSAYINVRHPHLHATGQTEQWWTVGHSDHAMVSFLQLYFVYA